MSKPVSDLTLINTDKVQSRHGKHIKYGHKASAGYLAKPAQRKGTYSYG
jgi:hypothetical protein